MVQQLRIGNQHFKTAVHPEHIGLFDGLATGQSPETLFITCADSRIDPFLITQSKPGDIFVIRNAGNIAPVLDDDGTSKDGTAASIDYAVAALGVSHIVVCGHSGCGAMAGLADLASLDALPSVARWLEHSHALLETNDPIDVDTLIERNALLQLEHLATYPTVMNALESGNLELHAWVYDIGSGEIREHNGDEFVPIAT